jgi:hypothetical protein
MTDPQIHLTKTLCAMRWIMLMNGRMDIANAIAYDLAHLRESLT